jgi:hypothetical protein
MSDNILKQAADALEERGKTYGSPYLDFSRTAKLWSVIIDKDLKPEQVALCLALVKVARLCNAKDFFHEDSVVDLAGYAACLEDVHKWRERIETAVEGMREKECCR